MIACSVSGMCLFVSMVGGVTACMFEVHDLFGLCVFFLLTRASSSLGILTQDV